MQVQERAFRAPGNEFVNEIRLRPHLLSEFVPLGLAEAARFRPESNRGDETEHDEQTQDRKLSQFKWLLGLRRGHRKPSRDRKSTRLNSSHLGISYAVFCLKKKK